MIPQIKIEDYEGEPRVKDLELAEALGFQTPSNIRKLIFRNEETLKQIEEVYPAIAQTADNLEQRIYYLTEKQALFIAVSSNMEGKAEVVIELQEAFSEFRNQAKHQSIQKLPIKIKDYNGVPRAKDLDIADSLGFGQLRDIRKIINRHIGTLKTLGEVRATVTQTKGNKGGRPSTVYYLTEEQAVYIATKSEAKNAIALTIEMVKIFTAWRNGTLDQLSDHPSATKVFGMLFQSKHLGGDPVEVKCVYQNGQRYVALATVRKALNEKVGNTLSYYEKLLPDNQKTLTTKDELPELFEGSHSSKYTLVTFEGLTQILRRSSFKSKTHVKEFVGWFGEYGNLIPMASRPILDKIPTYDELMQVH